ncbi:MAG TPA: hypothetical protein VL551_34050 [Actinospica sp.]|jgi:hypothetical protein|nr:hypothetical protein [Actinospica sp.]
MPKTAQTTAPAPNTVPGHVTPLPAHHAPDDAIRATLAHYATPRAGDAVTYHGGHVIWLANLEPCHPATFDNTLLWGTPLHGDGAAEHALWDENSITPLDPDLPGIDEDDAIALTAIWRALIEHSNTPTA